MPLRDHFHPPLSRQRHWESLHSAWANALRQQLNEDLLPPRYFAEVQVSIGRHFEVDVGTFEEAGASDVASGGGIAVWASPWPTRTADLAIPPLEGFAVRVFNDEQGPTLVAVVEIVSPANKNLPAHRHAFAVKCGSYLYQGLGLIVVDVVTDRGGNLDLEILDLIRPPTENAAPASVPDCSADLYASAYRTTTPTPQDTLRLESWYEPLHVGESLPTLPLWIGPGLCVPLDFERANGLACSSSRIE